MRISDWSSDVCSSDLRLMADAGVISMSLRDAALRAPLNFADDAPPPRRLPPSSVKAINGTRFELMRMLREPSLYTLDRLDLTADSSLDASVQAEVTALLRSLDDPEQLKALGMTGRSEEHTSELQSLMRISYAVFCLKKKKHNTSTH